MYTYTLYTNTRERAPTKISLLLFRGRQCNIITKSGFTGYEKRVRARHYRENTKTSGKT